MKRAAIDIGSNSIRLALPDGTVRSEITKLAEGLPQTGVLSPAGVDATVRVLQSFADAARAATDDIYVFATEAVRRAANGNEFMELVHKRTGLTVHLLSEQDEARLALAGAQKPDGAATVCDLGGGSMELISSSDGKTPDYIKSLPLGVVVLKSEYKGDYARLTADLPRLLSGYGSVPRYPLVISGGSACNIAAGLLDLKVYDRAAVSTKFTARALDDAIPMLLSPSLATLRPVCARRADTIPYGALVMRALLGYLGANEFYVSDAGNLDAVIKGA